MADPSRVKRTLERLATRPLTAGRLRPDDDYREVIDRAATAVEDLDAAGTFLEGVGLDTLESSVAAAEAAGDAAAARRGREALSTFRNARAAARGEHHFHSGRGTPKGGGAERSDE